MLLFIVVYCCLLLFIVVLLLFYCDDMNQDQLFIFPKEINHTSFAEVLNYIKTDNGPKWRRSFRKPISAGFTDGTRFYGSSETLNLKAREEDKHLMANGGIFQKEVA